MMDLDKIDWTKCELPSIEGIGDVVADTCNGLVLIHRKGNRAWCLAKRFPDGMWGELSGVDFKRLSPVALQGLSAAISKVDSFIEAELRRMAEETKPKTATVKAPEGMEWAFGSSLFLRRIGDTMHGGRCYGVPETRQWRDAMLACAAMYDLQAGAEPVVIGTKRYLMLMVEVKP